MGARATRTGPILAHSGGRRMVGRQGSQEPARGSAAASRKRQNELISAYARTLDPDDAGLERQGTRPTSGRVAFASSVAPPGGSAAPATSGGGAGAFAASSGGATSSSGFSPSDGYGGSQAVSAAAVVPPLVELMGGVGGRDLFGAGVGDLGDSDLRAGGGLMVAAASGGVLGGALRTRDIEAAHLETDDFDEVLRSMEKQGEDAALP